MPEDFRQEVDPINAIKKILDDYPLNDGPIREMIQNSNDARATRQVIVLDRRRHPTDHLINSASNDNSYAEYQQAPALIAYNDSMFQPHDWESLRKILDSSKTNNAEAIGQFGQGFRSVYHLTDCPQIFSGDTLVMLDVRNKNHGVKLTTTEPSDFSSHPTAFSGIPTVPYAAAYTPTSSARMQGTMIRLPLRSFPSNVSERTHKPDDIIKLLEEFIKHDLDIVLLFMQHVKCIEIWEILANGTTREIAKAETKEVEGSRKIIGGREGYETWQSLVGISVNLPHQSKLETKSTTWRILHCPFVDEHSLGMLKKLSPGYKLQMERRKFNQAITFATPLHFSPPLKNYGPWKGGRLFNGLPLPRSLSEDFKWPVHVNARFAITSSRQHLKHSNSDGIIEPSFEDKWNPCLFHSFISQAWTFLLHVLAKDDHVPNIFDFWPQQTKTYRSPFHLQQQQSKPNEFQLHSMQNSGESASETMMQLVFNCVMEGKSSIWPVYSSTSTSISTTVAASQISSTMEYAELGVIKVANEENHMPDLRNALAECGLRFTKPPKEIRGLIEKYGKRRFEFLEPKNVHAELLKNVSKLEEVISTSPKIITPILEYLLKSEDLSLLAGLPLLPNLDGQYVSLQKLNPRDEKQSKHTLLDDQTTRLFSSTYDSNAISLSSIPRMHISKFEQKSPGTLNVVPLNAQKVKDYLATDPRWSLGVTSYDNPTPLPNPLPNEITTFLANFWKWLSTCSFRDQFLRLPEVQEMYLVPTRLGLRKLQDPVFQSNIQPSISKCLRELGISLLDNNTVQSVLGHGPGGLGIVKKVDDIRSIIAGANIPSDASSTSTSTSTSKSTSNLNSSDCKALIEHIAKSVGSCEPESLTDEERKKLRSLPIFPILDPLDLPSPKPKPSSIPENATVMGVLSVEILPILERCVFLDLRGYMPTSYAILRFLTPPPTTTTFSSTGTSTSTSSSSSSSISLTTPILTTNLLNMAVDNFLSQPPAIRISTLGYISKHERNVTPAILERLWDKNFVLAKDGEMRKPADIVDPESNLGKGLLLGVKGEISKFPKGKGKDGESQQDTNLTIEGKDDISTVFDKYLPRMVGDMDKGILNDLRKLSGCPLKKTLDTQILFDITSWISENAYREEALILSRALWKLLKECGDSGNLVKSVPKEHRWIPTNSGLKAIHECRDRNSQSVLFDEVFSLVEHGIEIPDTLRAVFEWTEVIPRETLFNQLYKTLERGGDYVKVRVILKEIGSQDVVGEGLEKLKEILKDREWVPTKAKLLVKPENAVLGHAIEDAGFWEVSFNEADHSKVVELLKNLGVSERPMPESILSRMQQLGPLPLTPGEIASAVRLLEVLARGKIDETLRSQILIPDTRGFMIPLDSIQYNDTGGPITIEEDQKALAHPFVTSILAENLGLETLGQQRSQFGYLGEDTVESIKNVVNKYNETQIMIELLANAVDAKAKQFVLIIDEMTTSSDSKLISPKLAKFQNCPSLLVYNDAVFTQQDVHDLCKTGVGGKRNKVESIGQFGLGALTMFHLTELPMIISSNFALFIDPSRQHLKLPEGKNNQQLELQTLYQCYPGHLDFLHGLNEQFHLLDDDWTAFSGTLFRLPLRTRDHVGHTGRISATTWSINDLQVKILDRFKAIAHNCFLFTQLQSIHVYRRSSDGIIEQLWDIHATRTPPTSSGLYQEQMVEIIESKGHKSLWQTASCIVPEVQIPNDKFRSLYISNPKLRHPKAALAAYIRPKEAQWSEYLEDNILFSTMPLPVSTTLPVHCSSSFIMSDDRRHLRLELNENSSDQDRYNHWLLENIIPPLYLFLLEIIQINTGSPNHNFWPINSDPIADIIIPSLYENHLKQTTRRALASSYNLNFLSAQEAFVLDAKSLIRPVVDFLEPARVVRCEEPFLGRITDDAEVPFITPSFLKDEIMKDPERFTRAFQRSFNREKEEKGEIEGEGEGVEPILSLEILGYLIEFFLNPENNGDLDAAQLHGTEYLRPLDGLQLLPLENDTFATIRIADEAEYFLWTRDYYPPARFIDRTIWVKIEFQAAERLLNRGLNVVEITSPIMADLLSDFIPKQNYINISDDEVLQQNIETFYENFPQLYLEDEDIVEFPLVPTHRDGDYVSLNFRNERRIPIVPQRVSDNICQCLNLLGVRIIRPNNCPEPIRRILGNQCRDTDFKLIDILYAMARDVQDPQDIVDRFDDLQDEKAEFAEWARFHLLRNIPEERPGEVRIRPVAQKLPVWDACDRTGISQYVPAEDLVLLPANVHFDIVAPYLTQRVAVIGNDDRYRRVILTKLGVPELSFRELSQMVVENLPPAMLHEQQRRDYKVVVQMMLAHRGRTQDVQDLRVPNDVQYELKLVTELYARTTPFQEIFGEHSINFVCPEFDDLFGLPLKLKEGMDMATLEYCAQVVANGSDVDGGAVLFEELNAYLPILWANYNQMTWDRINSIEFVPRRRDTGTAIWRPGKDNGIGLGVENVGTELSAYIAQAFDDELVSLNQIVQEEFYGIAWSQRVLPDVPLGGRLKTLCPTLGVPTLVEVVNHLQVLVRVAREGHNLAEIIYDLEATYKYLDDRANEARNILRQHVNDPLFLNINNGLDQLPNYEDEPWIPAGNLSFDRLDVGTFKSAKSFLRNFSRLLEAAGAQSVNYPTFLHSSSGMPTTSTLDNDLFRRRMFRVREKYENMRREGQLVDVQIIAANDDPNAPLYAHRSFLAANIEHMETSFLSGFSEGGPASSTSPIELRMPSHSRECVAFVLDYIYTGHISEDVPISTLLEAGLNLAHYWHMEDLKEEITMHIRNQRLVDPNTVDEIKRCAHEYEAHELEQYCDNYCRENREYIASVRPRD